MTNNKENDPGSFDGRSARNDPKPTTPTRDPETHDALDPFDYPVFGGLDEAVVGGCSTCGSLQHATIKCDKKVPSEYLMSGALQSDSDRPTLATATNSSAAAAAAPTDAKGGQANDDTSRGQGANRRRSA